MKKLLLLPGANPEAAFDQCLDAAFLRATGKPVRDEPHFVRELISDATLRALNTAAATTYDENINSVRFAGSFIHGRPLAHFQAIAGGAPQSCSRELADAMVVLNETAPDANGLHMLVRRSATLLMFKQTKAKKPRCPRFDPSGSKLPNGTDQEQFYLFNRWPTFDLTPTGSAGSTRYSIGRPPGHPHPFSHGQFGMLWSPAASAGTSAWPHHWKAANPEPSTRLNRSLGTFLADMVDADPSAGRDFSTSAPATDWDRLILDLQQYAASSSWAAELRSANPAGLSFLQARDAIDTGAATFAQHADRSVLALYPDLMTSPAPTPARPSRRRRGPIAAEEGNFVPMLMITVSSFRRPQWKEPFSEQQRREAIDTAWQRLGL